MPPGNEGIDIALGIGDLLQDRPSGRAPDTLLPSGAPLPELTGIRPLQAAPVSA